MKRQWIGPSRDAAKAKSGLVLLACCAALLAALTAPRQALAAAPGENVTYESPVGIPTGSATNARPWNFTLALPPAAPGGPVQFVDISITNLPKIMPGETLAQASKRKADAVAAAVNGKLGAGRAMVFQKKTKVQVGTRIQRTPLGPRLVPIYQTVNLSYVRIKGLYTIPDKPGKPGTGTPSVNFKTNPTLEFGDGGKNKPGIGVPPASPGETTGALGGTGIDVASGMDTDGNQSFVSIGEAGAPTVSVLPTSGESSSQVLTDLSTQLAASGVSNTFDPSSDTLFLTPSAPFRGGFTFSDTDTGLDLAFSVTGASVPEPAEWALLLAGMALLGAAARSGRRRPARA